MIFIGFGFLMTFLHAHSWSAVGLNFLLSCVALQWSILTVEFFKRTDSKSWTTIEMDIKTLIEAGTSTSRCLHLKHAPYMYRRFRSRRSNDQLRRCARQGQLYAASCHGLLRDGGCCRCSCLAARRRPVSQIFYGINHMCVYIRLHAIDMGGSMVSDPASLHSLCLSCIPCTRR